jgi:hypothetical protein
VPRYVGKGIGARWKSHRVPSCKTRLGNTLKKRYRDNGEWVLPIIAACADESHAIAEEIRLIAFYGREDRKLGSLWNNTNGGDGASGYKHKDELKKRFSEERHGEKNPFYGLSHSDEVKKIISETHKGHHRFKGAKLSLERRKQCGSVGDKNPATKVKRADHPKVFALKDQGLTQKQIGEIFGVTQGQVSKILLGGKYYEPTIS